MRKFALVLAVVLLPISICCAEENIAESRSWDFGKVKEGVKLEHEFILTNNSDKVLNVKDVTTSCGCTVSEVKKKVLEPKESTTIKVTFNSKGYSGTIHQFVYVNTDSSVEPIVQFKIKAFVEKK